MRNLFNWLCFLLVVIILVMAALGCNPEKKIQKAVDTLNKADKLDDVCAEEFPVKDSVIKGDTVIHYDTLWGAGETVYDTVETKDTVYITRTLPGKTITKTVKVVDTVIRRDFAYENVLKDEIRDKDSQLAERDSIIKKLTSENNKYKKRSRNYLWIILALAAFAFRKQILHLIKKII